MSRSIYGDINMTLSKKFLGLRCENFEVCSALPVSDRFLVQFGPNCIHIGSKFGQKQVRFVHFRPKFGLKQVKRIFPLQTSPFSHRYPKNFFECTKMPHFVLYVGACFSHGIGEFQRNLARRHRRSEFVPVILDCPKRD